MMKIIPGLTDANFNRNVPLKRVEEFANSLNEVLDDYMIKAGDSVARGEEVYWRVNGVTKVIQPDGSQREMKNLNKILADEAVIIAKACPWLAQALAVLTIFSIASTASAGVRVASNIASESPEVTEAFDNFYRLYKNEIDQVLRTGNAPSNLQMHHLIERFEKYLIAIALPAEVRNPIITGMHSKIDLEYP